MIDSKLSIDLYPQVFCYLPSGILQTIQLSKTLVGVIATRELYQRKNRTIKQVSQPTPPKALAKAIAKDDFNTVRLICLFELVDTQKGIPVPIELLPFQITLSTTKLINRDGFISIVCADGSPSVDQNGFVSPLLQGPRIEYPSLDLPIYLACSTFRPNALRALLTFSKNIQFNGSVILGWMLDTHQRLNTTTNQLDLMPTLNVLIKSGLLDKSEYAKIKHPLFKTYYYNTPQVISALINLGWSFDDQLSEIDLEEDDAPGIGKTYVGWTLRDYVARWPRSARFNRLVSINK